MLAVLLASMISLINASRGYAHVAPLTEDRTLDARAQARAELMCSRGQFSHDGYLLAFQGLPYGWKGENLAKGYRDPESTHTGLMNSPGHRANILKREFDTLGVGHARDITVELFGGH